MWVVLSLFPTFGGATEHLRLVGSAKPAQCRRGAMMARSPGALQEGRNGGKAAQLTRAVAVPDL